MTDQLRQEIANDIEVAKRMTDIQSPEMVIELTNRLIGYLDIVNQSIAEHDYISDQLKGKQKILLEYIRTSKNFATNLSINRHHELKNKY